MTFKQEVIKELVAGDSCNTDGGGGRSANVICAWVRVCVTLYITAIYVVGSQS